MTTPPFFFNDPATTEIYTLSLHDALPILKSSRRGPIRPPLCATRNSRSCAEETFTRTRGSGRRSRSEEHTSELQSQSNLVCRLLLEKKKRYHCARSARLSAPPLCPPAAAR